MRIVAVFLLFFSALPFPVFAQGSPSWDTSGNQQLTGKHHFREIIYITGDYSGTLRRAVSVYGTISFDGNGKYVLTGALLDSDDPSNSPRPYTVDGTYGVASSGFGSISSPVWNGDVIHGLVSNGIFIGSSTESGFNDLFIAVPASSPAAVESTFQGAYWITSMNFPGKNPGLARNALFQLNADGKGSVAETVNVTGYIAGSGATAVKQAVSGIQYTFRDGVGTLSFPGGGLSDDLLIAGERALYTSPDGGFVFGGSTHGWDMFVGLRATPSSADDSVSGLYYQAGLDLDVSEISNGRTALASYYGSFIARAERIVGHQRINSPVNGSAYDYTYAGSYSSDGDGTIIKEGGLARIGFNTGPYLGISVALRSPSLSGSGVFLNPTGVVNAASSAPFTAGIAPGQLITLYGTNLAPSGSHSATAPFPASLAGVQVLINDRPAPVCAAAPNQISAVVPYSTELPIAKIQVINNGAPSNAVTMYMNLTAPGTFTVPPGGIGYGAVLHADYSLVTPSNPAQAGETLAVYVTGLGKVNGHAGDGAAGPYDASSVAANEVGVNIDERRALVTYAGLAPGLAGAYQVNVQVPSGIHSGDVYLDLSGPDSYSSGSLIPIAPGKGTIVPGGNAAAVRKSPSRRILHKTTNSR